MPDSENPTIPGFSDPSGSGLGVASEVTLNPFRQKTLPATLTAPCQGGATSFGSHAGTKTVLLFARSF